MNCDLLTKPEVADFIEAKKEVTFKIDLHSRNSVGTLVTSRLGHIPKVIKIDQYLLFFINVLAVAKCGGRPLKPLKKWPFNVHF